MTTAASRMPIEIAYAVTQSVVRRVAGSTGQMCRASGLVRGRTTHSKSAATNDAASISAQRRHRVHARRAQRRDHARGDADQGEDGGRAGEDRWIAWRDTV